MATMATILDQMAEPEQRRAFRLLHPGVQLRLAAYVLAVTAGFAALFAFNSWAAYGEIYGATLSSTEAPFEQEIGAQTRSYVGVSLVLLVGYSLTMLAVTIAYVHRLIGPTVAVERHVRALERGDFTSRVALRDDEVLYTELAYRLNGLATRLQTGISSRDRS